MKTHKAERGNAPSRAPTAEQCLCSAGRGARHRDSYELVSVPRLQPCPEDGADMVNSDGDPCRPDWAYNRRRSCLPQSTCGQPRRKRIGWRIEGRALLPPHPRANLKTGDLTCVRRVRVIKFLHGRATTASALRAVPHATFLLTASSERSSSAFDHGWSTERRPWYATVDAGFGAAAVPSAVTAQRKAGRAPA